MIAARVKQKAAWICATPFPRAVGSLSIMEAATFTSTQLTRTRRLQMARLRNALGDLQRHGRLFAQIEATSGAATPSPPTIVSSNHGQPLPLQFRPATHPALHMLPQRPAHAEIITSAALAIRAGLASVRMASDP